MKFANLWTLVWERTGELVPALDEGADGILMLTEESARKEAARQSETYASEPGDLGLGRIIAEPIEILH